MNAQVLDAIKKSAAVPSVPQVVTRFLQIMQDPNFEYSDMVKVLSADPGTVSEILRLANSALFGLRQKVVSLRQALTLLGPKRTRSLLLGRYLVDAVSRKRVDGLDMSYFWRRSLSASVVASRFADIVIPRKRDEVFISALLADIGIPILAEAVPDRYHAIAARFAPHARCATAADELQAIDATHAQVSAMVLAHWSLPEVLVRAVNLHQCDEPGDDDAGGIARLLNAADRIAKLLCEVSSVDEVASVCTAATAFAGVDLQTLADILPTIERDIEELADALRIDVIPSEIYAVIARTVREHIGDPKPA
ncbi:MAG: HDOD domain-containing protein [Planctomycetes bacterium]|nr:HDOD domain-containing protein [Planctomycetota bacterium]